MSLDANATMTALEACIASHYNSRFKWTQSPGSSRENEPNQTGSETGSPESPRKRMASYKQPSNIQAFYVALKMLHDG